MINDQIKHFINKFFISFSRVNSCSLYIRLYFFFTFTIQISFIGSPRTIIAAAVI